MKTLLLALMLLAPAAHATDQLTPNYGFDLPPLNSLNWGVKISTDWQIADQALSGLALSTGADAVAISNIQTSTGNLNNQGLANALAISTTAAAAQAAQATANAAGVSASTAAASASSGFLAVGIATAAQQAQLVAVALASTTIYNATTSSFTGVGIVTAAYQVQLAANILAISTTASVAQAAAVAASTAAHPNADNNWSSPQTSLSSFTITYTGSSYGLTLSSSGQAKDWCIVGGNCLSQAGTGSGNVAATGMTNGRIPYASGAQALSDSPFNRDSSQSLTVMAATVTVPALLVASTFTATGGPVLLGATTAQSLVINGVSTMTGQSFVNGGLVLPYNAAFAGGWYPIAYASGTNQSPMFNFAGLASSQSYRLELNVFVASGTLSKDLISCQFNNSSLAKYYYVNGGVISNGNWENTGTAAYTRLILIAEPGSSAWKPGDSQVADMEFTTAFSSPTTITWKGKGGGMFDLALGWTYTLAGSFWGNTALSSINCYVYDPGIGIVFEARLSQYGKQANGY